ncbi:MAG TPA: hypothetical protein VFE65_30340 [Pseudonocardia sp.]|nr:hypothetical protein [Pseudonocardia sp.]
MGQLAKELRGKMKKTVGKMTGNEELRRKGQVEDEEAMHAAEQDRAGTMNSGIASNILASEESDLPGMPK